MRVKRGKLMLKSRKIKKKTDKGRKREKREDKEERKRKVERKVGEKTIGQTGVAETTREEKYKKMGATFEKLLVNKTKTEVAFMLKKKMRMIEKVKKKVTKSYRYTSYIRRYIGYSEVLSQQNWRIGNYHGNIYIFR